MPHSLGSLQNELAAIPCNYILSSYSPLTLAESAESK